MDKDTREINLVTVVDRDNSYRGNSYRQRL